MNTKKSARDERHERAHDERREYLDDARAAIVHKFDILGHEGYIRAGMYPDGRVGEIFVKMNKVGTNVSGMMDAFATAVSLLLQYGVSVETLGDKFIGARFDPQGWTKNPAIREATSVVDYIFRYLISRFGEEARNQPVPASPPATPEAKES